VTKEIFARTVPIDYRLLRTRCAALKAAMERACALRVNAPGGTQVSLSLEGRGAFIDDGDFTRPGCGGNLPAGEVFSSPVVGSARGRIVFDGSMSLNARDIRLDRPIVAELEDGFITSISGGPEAAALLETVADAERRALRMEEAGQLPAGKGAVYARNARNLGEIGIGLNPSASISGNMLEDEKAMGTCHFAVGHNYDGDAPALIHLDGLVRSPTVFALMPDGGEECLMRDGLIEATVGA
jgi:leucyl aminopeptidase (aminopeptidase T)